MSTRGRKKYKMSIAHICITRSRYHSTCAILIHTILWATHWPLNKTSQFCICLCRCVCGFSVGSCVEMCAERHRIVIDLVKSLFADYKWDECKNGEYAVFIPLRAPRKWNPFGSCFDKTLLQNVVVMMSFPFRGARFGQIAHQLGRDGTALRVSTVLHIASLDFCRDRSNSRPPRFPAVSYSCFFKKAPIRSSTWWC